MNYAYGSVASVVDAIRNNPTNTNTFHISRHALEHHCLVCTSWAILTRHLQHRRLYTSVYYVLQSQKLQLDMQTIKQCSRSKLRHKIAYNSS